MVAMERTQTHKLRIEKENFKLELERAVSENLSKKISMEKPREEDEESIIPFSATVADHLKKHDPTLKGLEEDQPGNFVTSPIVGTFYASSSPDRPPFVQEGDRIEKGDVVCIIEAMKVMNEVRSSISGVVSEILVENGHPVEFGTKLLRIL